MSEFTDRLKGQVEQFNNSIDQIINASRGLYIKLKEESNKQFDEWVKTGEAQKLADESLLSQIRKDIASPFDDVKGSLDHLRSASLGLVIKAREAGEQYFNELVELGTAKEQVTE